LAEAAAREEEAAVAAEVAGDGNFATGETAATYKISMSCQKNIIAR
jgi:hypothetical protein